MARYIPDEILDRIRLSADIIDVVQSYVPTLKKAGQTWKACCPFHHEKTPSFVVNPSRQIYKCFGCGKGGDAFHFIMEMEKLDFPNAAEFLARKYNIIIPEEPVRQKHGGKMPLGNLNAGGAEADYNIRERLYTLHEKLAAFYRSNLLANPQEPVPAYFRTRMIPDEWADKFMIGASPDSWDASIQFARRAGFSDEELRLAGVVSEKENSDGHIYDRFRNRLMFPIWNEQGRIVAFSARSIEKDPKGWKYLNSPETPIFKKSRTLYALNFARKEIVEKKCAVLCEGQLDTIALHRAGCTNAVAPQGTAFGPDQGSVLKRHTDTICLAPDNDKAGREAVFKDAAILLPLGFYLKVAVYSGAKDADEVLKTQGPEALHGYIESAVDFFDFALSVYKEDHDVASPAGKSAAASEMIRWLLLIENPVTRDLYAAWLAEKLGVARTMIESVIETKLREEERRKLYSRRFQQETQTAPEKTEKAMPEGLQNACLDLLRVLLKHEEYADAAAQDLPSDLLPDFPLSHAIEIVIQAKINGEWEDAAGQITMELSKRGADLSLISGILIEEDAVPTEPLSASELENQKKVLANTYNTAIRKILYLAYTERRNQILQEASALPDCPEKLELLRQFSDLSKELMHLRDKHIFRV